MERPTDKAQIIGMLQDIFNRWQEQLAGMSEEEVTAPNLPDGWSTKDLVAHLWTWQQRTLARIEAGLQDREPDYPKWPDTLPPDPDDDTEHTNEWIYNTNRDRPWSSVYAGWRDQFQHIIDLSEPLTQHDLFEPTRYPWMGGYPLAASYLGSYEHHVEHLDDLRGHLSRQGQC